MPKLTTPPNLGLPRDTRSVEADALPRTHVASTARAVIDGLRAALPSRPAIGVGIEVAVLRARQVASRAIDRLPRVDIGAMPRRGAAALHIAIGGHANVIAVAMAGARKGRGAGAGASPGTGAPPVPAYAHAPHTGAASPADLPPPYEEGPPRASVAQFLGGRLPMDDDDHGRPDFEQLPRYQATVAIDSSAVAPAWDAAAAGPTHEDAMTGHADEKGAVPSSTAGSGTVVSAPLHVPAEGERVTDGMRPHDIAMADPSALVAFPFESASRRASLSTPSGTRTDEKPGTSGPFDSKS